jgi:hypothetical protein
MSEDGKSEKHLETLERASEFSEVCTENEELIVALYARGSMTRSQIEDEGYAVKWKNETGGRFISGFRRLLGVGVIYKEELDFKLTPNYRAVLDGLMVAKGDGDTVSFFADKAEK